MKYGIHILIPCLAILLGCNSNLSPEEDEHLDLPLKWTRVPGSYPNLLSVVWGDSGFVAVGATRQIFVSEDGSEWNDIDPTDSMEELNVQLFSVAWEGGRYFALGQGKKCSGSSCCIRCRTEFLIFVSNNGRTWNRYSVAPLDGGNTISLYRRSLLAIAWSGTTFMAVGDSGYMMTSPDAVTWTVQNAGGLPGPLISILWTNSGFLIFNNGPAIIHSPNGITWTWHSGDLPSPVYNVKNGNNMFLAMGENGFATSSDGFSWTKTPLAPGSYGSDYGLTWTGSQWVAVGWVGIISTSKNGVTWTTQQLDTYPYLNSVAWSGENLVAVGTGVIFVARP